jgi:hypothetical protein
MTTPTAAPSVAAPTVPNPDSMIRIRQAVLTACCALALLAAAMSPARAGYFLAHIGDTVSVTGSQPASSETATISFAGLPSTPLSVYSSPEMLSGVYGAASTPFSGLLFYCSDLYNYSATPATYTVGYLTSSHQPSVGNVLSSMQLNKITTLLAGNYADHSATQLAIWSIEYGNAFSFSGTSSQVANDVTSYLGGLDGSAPAGFRLFQLQASGVQGFAFISPVPEPTTLALLGAGLIGVSVAKRRRRADCQRRAA